MYLKDSKTVIIKIGSSLLIDDNKIIREKWLSEFAKDIKDEGETLSDFMILEYDDNGSFQGRLDGSSAKLISEYWEMKDVQISPKFSDSYFKESFKYHTNIKIEDIMIELKKRQKQ